MESNLESEPVIELFSIGTELTLGQIQDTNAHWIAQQTFQLGGTIRRISMIRDDFDEMKEAIQDSIEHRQTGLVITTGGLGPTPDDMTVEIIAEIIGKDLVVDQNTVQNYMERRLLRDRSEVGEALVKMATVPETAVVFQNPVGWAPCISVEVKQSTLVMMPGPPREMQAVFENHIAPIISKRFSAAGSSIRIYVDLHESGVSPLMQQVMEKFPNVYVKAYVALRETDRGMPIDIITTSSSQDDVELLLQESVNYFREIVTAQGNSFRIDTKQKN